MKLWLNFILTLTFFKKACRNSNSPLKNSSGGAINLGVMLIIYREGRARNRY